VRCYSLLLTFALSSRDWMRNNDVLPGELPPLEKFKKLGTIPVSRRTPEQRMKDLRDAMNWTRNKGKDDEAFDPTTDFRKLDGMLPLKKGQSPSDRARAIEMALDWVRTSGPSSVVGDVIEPTVITKSLSVVVRSPEERKKDLLSALNWLRNGKQQSDDPSGSFKKIDQMLPVKPAHSTEDRARELEGCMDWMRNNGVAPTAIDTVESMSKFGSLPVSHRTPEQRVQDLESAMTWLRNKGVDDEALDPTGEFRKLDAALPRKSDQNHQERARQIESALDWLREKVPIPAFEDDRLSIQKSSFIPVCTSTPDERSCVMKDVFKWIRNGRKPADDPTGDFRQVDQVLPLRIGQSPEARAREIEGAM
jgi:hypothetical protein